MALEETADQASIPDTSATTEVPETEVSAPSSGSVDDAASTVTTTESSRDVVAQSAPEPASESSADSGEQADVPPSSPSSAAMPSAEDFDWDNWDMRLENLPEVLHPWLRKALTPYVQIHDQNVQKMSQTQAAYAELKQMYDALLMGAEDPRIAQFEQTKVQHAQELQERDTRIQELEAEVADNDKRYQEYIKSESEEWTRHFLAIHGETLKNENTLKVFQGFWNRVNDPYVAIELAKMPRDAQMVAARAVNDGTPAHVVLQLAKMKVEQIKGSAPTPREAARFTNGADGAGMTPVEGEIDPLEGVNSLSDYRNAIAERAFKRLRR